MELGDEGTKLGEVVEQRAVVQALAVPIGGRPMAGAACGADLVQLVWHWNGPRAVRFFIECAVISFYGH
ncbi:hypothetical protein WS68_11545 [Burkholderia sp. TSV86]|nr:hypothetical protein WS68_11545 [Burkholderia sp. TSV86]